jgi:hypothetical protein
MQQNIHSHFLHKLLQIWPMFIWTFWLKMIPGACSYVMDILLQANLYK